jgi:hypothetical protein
MNPHELPPPAQLMNLIAGKMVTQAIAAAVELGLCDALKDATKSADDLARATGTNADGLYRLLRALSLVGVVVETEDKRFKLTPTGTLLRSDVPGTLAGMARFMGAPFHGELWFELPHCVKTGENAIKKRHGHADPFEYFHARPAELAMFQTAMSSFSSVVVDALVRGYDFQGLGRIADIGGGHGAVLAGILKANPGATGVLFDRPDVVGGAKSVLGELADRCEVIAGDFFASVPAGCDGYVFKHIVHDWSDEHCVKFLRNTATVMAPNGRVLVVEHVVPPAGVPSFGKLLDLEMLVFTAGGRERTEAEFRDLFAQAGLRLARVVPLSAPVSVIEAVLA